MYQSKTSRRRNGRGIPETGQRVRSKTTIPGVKWSRTKGTQEDGDLERNHKSYKNLF